MNKKEIEEVEKHNEYVMERMHPAVILPGLFLIVVLERLKIY